MSSPREIPSPGGDHSDPLDWARKSGGGDFLLREMQHELRRRRRRRISASAGLLGCLLVSLWFFGAGGGRTPPMTAESATATLLEVDRRQLPDGTVAELSVGAAMVADFDAKTRRVKVQGGEVLFHVRKDPARPFVVEAEGVAVRAVGTAFAVQVRAEGVDVLVTEGVVAVQRRSADVGLATLADVEVTVNAGSRATVDKGEPDRLPRVTKLTGEEINRALAWRIPRLQFRATGLAEVVSMFNAHAERLRQPLLALGDPSLASLPVSGTLRADDIDSLLRLLGAEFDIVAVWRDGRRVLERR